MQGNTSLSQTNCLPAREQPDIHRARQNLAKLKQLDYEKGKGKGKTKNKSRNASPTGKGQQSREPSPEEIARSTSPKGKSSGKSMCKFFAKGACTRGATCAWSHEADSQKAAGKGKKRRAATPPGPVRDVRQRDAETAQANAAVAASYQASAWAGGDSSTVQSVTLDTSVDTSSVGSWQHVNPGHKWYVYGNEAPNTVSAEAAVPESSNKQGILDVHMNPGWQEKGADSWEKADNWTEYYDAKAAKGDFGSSNASASSAHSTPWPPSQPDHAEIKHYITSPANVMCARQNIV